MAWSFIWEDANGNTVQMNDPPDYEIIYRSLDGWTAPPFTPVTQPTPLQPGSYFKYMNVGDTTVDLTMLVTGASTESDLWDNINDIGYSFNPLLGQGILKITTPNSLIRYLDCYCTSGFLDNQSTQQPRGLQFNLSFFAPYPYWYNPNINTTTISLTEDQAEWFPILPLILGVEEELTATFNAQNIGDVDSPPTIVIYGPGDDPLISNLTTGEKIEFSGVTLTDTDNITIDCKEKTVVNQSGTNYLSYVTYDSNFWDLERGTDGNNQIQIQMTNATSDSEIVMTWYDWYVGVGT